MDKKQIWAVIVAAGRGTRFGKPYNKVFHPLDGQSILTRCINALTAAVKLVKVDLNVTLVSVLMNVVVACNLFTVFIVRHAVSGVGKC